MAKDKPKRRKRPIVTSRHGRYRFQTGMVTASLLQRGLDMEDAFAISNAIRDQIVGMTEITSDELEARTRALASERLGIAEADLPPRRTEQVSVDVPMVQHPEGMQPFSRGILLRQLITAGLAPEEAMSIAQDTYDWLLKQVPDSTSSAQVQAEVSARLSELHDAYTVRRYRFTCWVRETQTPFILLIGGATGTGKSSLATELAFRLGIRMVTSTDMIRETMRVVLSPDVVPGLHDHSFRGMLQGGQVLSDPQERVLAGYRQQAAQVGVGIRAVIRRAVRENAHMIIEGTHIRPPFHRYISPGTDVMVAGLVLAVPDEKRHRKRFPRRAQGQGMRDPDTYLEAFQSVRWIHDDLLADAEDAGAVVVGNDDLDVTLQGVVDYLSRALPFEDRPTRPKPRPVGPFGPRTLFIIIDGLADEPNSALDGATPLAAAHTPTLDLLAGGGGLGQVMTTRDPDKAATTNEGLLALLGETDMSARLGRGLLEALGSGIPLVPGAVCFRGNMATVQPDGNLSDRRAGRIRAGVEDLLVDLRDVALPGGVRGRIFAGHEHRLIVMLQGAELSAAVRDTDPGGEAMVQRALTPDPLDDSPEAARTSAALKALLERAHEVLDAHPLNDHRRSQGLFPANCIITRGAARIGDLPPPRHTPDHAALVSACPTAIGVARVVGMQGATPPGATGNLDTDLDAKFGAARRLLENRHFVAIHIKGTDIAAHDRRPLEKRDFISEIDAALGRLLASSAALVEDLRIIVSADHGTSSITGLHIPDPVPLLVARWSPDGEMSSFDEESAAQGALGLIHSGELSAMLWSDAVGSGFSDVSEDGSQ
jgi:2,3-bisphosphoglycerate-independent phosphoglycerate mutase